MRHAASLLVLPLILASGPALKAQNPHMGFSLNLTLPTGEFASKSYPNLLPPEKETYDAGLGGSFTVSFPVDRSLAIRLNLSGSAEDGRNTTPNSPGSGTINLRHSMFSIGGDLQLFPQGTAFRHRGLYFITGLSADFEKFEGSLGGDPTYYPDYSASKSRLGGSIGLGHSFGYDSGMRFTMEATFHKTLTGKDSSAGDPPSTDFVKLGFGLVF
jgi:hypothetical protein